MFLGSEDLYRDGRKVGFSGIVCTAVRTQHAPAAFECMITAHLPGGDVTVQGFSFDQPTNTFAITGGTSGGATPAGRWLRATSTRPPPRSPPTSAISASRIGALRQRPAAADPAESVAGRLLPAAGRRGQPLRLAAVVGGDELHLVQGEADEAVTERLECATALSDRSSAVLSSRGRCW
jgi:hypothetical protein